MTQNKNESENETLCHFSIDESVHPQPVPATMMLQVGAPNQPGGTKFIFTCKPCAMNVNAERRAQFAMKQKGELDAQTHVMDVLTMNLRKAQALERAATKNGEGLVERSGACSCIKWDGEACDQDPVNQAVAFGGHVYELCHSCSVTAKAVSVKTGIAAIHPIAVRDAQVRAKRQSEDKKEREQKKAAARTPKPVLTPSAPPKPSPFALAVTATVPVRTAPKTMVIGRHLRDNHAA